MMAKRAKADAQDVKNRYATNKRHARGGMNDSKILRGWGAIELYAGESRKTLLRKGYPVQKDSGGSVWADSEDMDKQLSCALCCIQRGAAYAHRSQLHPRNT